MADRDETDSATDVAQFSDRELVAACLENDPRAWEALICRYQRLIYSIPVKQGFSSVDAADVFQSVCLILLRKLPSLRDHDKLFSWLMTTTTRECYRVAARWQREGPVARREDDERAPLAEVPAAAVAEDERLAMERQQLLREAVARLPERCRQLIALLFYDRDELSYAEIAARLHIPVASIGPTRARCLQKLKKEMGENF